MAKNDVNINDVNKIGDNNSSSYTPFTINEIVNVIGENYVTTAKRVKALATRNNLRVSEKLINNRAVTTYYLSTKELTELKSSFTSLKMQNAVKNENAINTYNTSNTDTKKDEIKEDIIVKYCKLVEDNSELQKSYEDLEKAHQKAENDLIQSNAELSIVRNDLKYIEDKQKTFESENSRLSQELSAVQKQLNQRNTIIIGLCAVILCALTILLTINFTR